MPELFGSVYITMAIIVVVLVLAAVGLLVLRKRSAGAAGKAEKSARAARPGRAAKPAKAAEFGAPPRAKMSRADKKAAAAAAAAVPAFTPGVTTGVDFGGAPEAAPAPAAPRATPPPGKYAQPGLRESSSLRADPLQTVLTSILQGWGDLTAEDTNRLEVFRRDRVLAAIMAVELPKDMKGSEYARTRLTQLKRYANYLEQDQTPPEPSAVNEFVGIGGLGAPATAVAVAAAETVAAPAESAPAPVSTPPAPARPAQAAWYGDPAAGVEETAGEVRAGEFSWGDEPADDLAETAGEVRAGEFSWGDEPAQPVEEIGEDTAELVPVEDTPPPDPSWANEPGQAAVAAAAAAFWAAPEAPRMEAAAEADGRGIDLSLASLHGNVSTALDIMALPASERADMLAFLQPAELSKVFRSSTDANLKKAVIDTLEHVGSPASLDVIHECLDDSDPLIQLYALDAADRLLGTQG